ncbi:MAG: histidine phosphatase family protein [Xenococcaceae cyanobacterium MO_167.B27]|nr:histidine phosphatase family protein [Xenococcaceae cyanobacterium MO_167.B27]
MNRTVWIARHGNRFDFVYPEWFNTAERRYDPPLSEDGLLQGYQLGKRLQSENINHIFSSPFLRTIQTAHQIADILDLPIKLEAGLSEWFNPNWMSETPQTHPREILEDKYHRIDWNYCSYLHPQYPETETEVNYRTGKTAKWLVDNFPDNLLLVGHSASVMGATQILVPNTPIFKTPVGSLVKLIGNQQGWQLELAGDTSHLERTQK